MTTTEEQQAELTPAEVDVDAELLKLLDEQDAWLLAELDRDYPPAWQPVEGEVIIGDVIEVQESIYTRHGAVPVVTLQGRAGGRKAVWLVHTVLRNEFMRKRPMIGERVAIRYKGRVDRQDADPYDDYRVAVFRDKFSAEQPNWDAIAAVHNPSLVRLRAIVPPSMAIEADRCTECGGQGTHSPGCSQDVPFS